MKKSVNKSLKKDKTPSEVKFKSKKTQSSKWIGQIKDKVEGKNFRFHKINIENIRRKSKMYQERSMSKITESEDHSSDRKFIESKYK